MNKFLVCFCVFSGFSETKNGKSKYIFGSEGLQGLPVWLSICGGGGVHWVQVMQTALAILLMLAKMDKIPSFRPFAAFALGALPAYMALFRILRRFLAGFGVRMCVCMGLVLCVVCRAFVCVSG